MPERKGFTLAELMISVLIFGFMITSLATIYSTANKHMFQDYRHNTVKTNALVAMKDITAALLAANRIDCPCRANPCPSVCPANTVSNVLAVAVNIDQTGCYPVHRDPKVTPSWHYFCYFTNVVPGDCDSGRCIYHHTATLTGTGPGCPTSAACTGCFGISFYPAYCGTGGGGTVTKIAELVSPPTLSDGSSGLFSRRAAEGIYGDDQVKVMLRVFWDPQSLTIPGASNTIGRKIDSTLTTVVRLNRSAN